MKNVFKARVAQVFGLFALVAAIGFSIAACKNDPEDTPGAPPTDARLGISGLSAHSGKWVCAKSSLLGTGTSARTLIAGDDVTISDEDSTITGVKISGASANLKVWVIDYDDKIEEYNASDSGVSFTIYIINEESIDDSNLSNVAPTNKATVTVSFTNGVSTTSFQ